MQPTITYIQNLVDHIENNLTEEINIIRLANSFHVSPWHFQRLFKAFAGDSLGGYIRGRRLTKAARLLLTTDLGVTDIAFRAGFNSHEVFTRAFRLYFGRSPKDFRKVKPTVILNEKPLLSMELMHHLTEEITHEPVIKVVKTHNIVGVSTTVPSPFISNDAYCDSLYPSRMSLLSRQAEVEHRLSKTFYGLTVSPSGDFTEDTLQYIAGIPTTLPGIAPKGMVSFSFPEQLVAMFSVSTIDKDTVAKTIDFIYGYWLPNSPYVRGSGSDYELFENVTDFEDPTLGSKYVIPIAPKK
jgi:AraC family transcriptional regulator